MSQVSVKFRIAFQRKDLVSACWGSSKGADLLYHFIHKASREAENKQIPESCKSIPFQETQEKILEFTGLCKRSLNTWLKLFHDAGYVQRERYGKSFTVDLMAIEQAFTKPPVKPGLEQKEQVPGKPKVAKVEHSESITLPLSEWQEMQQKVLLLQQKVAKVEQYLAKVELSQSSESASQNGLEVKNEPLYALVCSLNDSERREGAKIEETKPAHVDAIASVPPVEDPIPFKPDYSLSEKPVSAPEPEPSAELVLDSEELTPKQAMARKVQAAFLVLEATKKEALADPWACYVLTKADEKRLASLITDHQGTSKAVSKANLRDAWLSLYNRPDKWWQEPGRLTLNAFCNNYGAAMDLVLDARKLEEKRKVRREEVKKANPLEALRRQQAQFERKVAAL